MCIRDSAGGANGYGQDGISALLGTTATDSYVFVTNNNSAFNSYAISLDGAVSDSDNMLQMERHNLQLEETLELTEIYHRTKTLYLV